MNFEKYTDRSRGFVQSAQSLAQREGHQQFAPEHLLKVLLDDPEGLAAGLIDRAGGNLRAALAAVEALRKGRPADSASAENAYDALKRYARDLTQAARDGKLDPVIGRDEEI